MQTREVTVSKRINTEAQETFKKAGQKAWADTVDMSLNDLAQFLPEAL